MSAEEVEGMTAARLTFWVERAHWVNTKLMER
jgi:hypothetical protein